MKTGPHHACSACAKNRRLSHRVIAYQVHQGSGMKTRPSISASMDRAETGGARRDGLSHELVGASRTSVHSSAATPATMALGSRRTATAKNGTPAVHDRFKQPDMRRAAAAQLACDRRHELGQRHQQPPSWNGRQHSSGSSGRLSSLIPQRNSSSSVDSIKSKGSVLGAGYCLRMYDWQPPMRSCSKRKDGRPVAPPTSSASWCCMQ